MKKISAKLFAALLLPLASALFFSCATTQGKANLTAQNEAAQNSSQDPKQDEAASQTDEAASQADESASQADETYEAAAANASAQDGSQADETGKAGEAYEAAPELTAAPAAEEKISESEMRELEALLAQNSPADGGQSGAEDGEKRGVQYGSLLEKIRASSKSGGQDSSQGQTAAGQESERAASPQDSDNNSSQDDKAGRGQNTSVALASSSGGKTGAASSSAAAGSNASGLPQKAGPSDSREAPNGGGANAPSANNANAANKGAAANGGEGLSRVTSQGNNIAGGPLIGPDSVQQETNEGIALALPQTEAEEAVPEEKKPEPVASRSMAIKNNQFVDIVYPGSGWIYLGEEDSGGHFIFQGRKLGNGETTFTLRSKKPGTALLHFYKNDILTGNYIDDWIEINVGEKSAADSIHQKAPSYAEVVPPKFDHEKNKEENEKAIAQAAAKKQAERESQSAQEPKAARTEKEAPAKAESGSPKKEAAEQGPSEKVQTVIQTAGQEKGESKQKTAVAGNNGAQGGQKAGSSSAQAGGSGASQKSQGGAAGNSAQSLLERAQKAYDEKKYEEALDLVQQFFEAATDDFDAGLYLEGLILEAKSSVRNIKSAIDAYDTLIKNWPQSRFWRKANERAIYLKRFYIDIR